MVLTVLCHKPVEGWRIAEDQVVAAGKNDILSFKVGRA